MFSSLSYNHETLKAIPFFSLSFCSCVVFNHLHFPFSMLFSSPECLAPSLYSLVLPFPIFFPVFMWSILVFFLHYHAVCYSLFLSFISLLLPSLWCDTFWHDSHQPGKSLTTETCTHVFMLQVNTVFNVLSLKGKIDVENQEIFHWQNYLNNY